MSEWVSECGREGEGGREGGGREGGGSERGGREGGKRKGGGTNVVCCVTTQTTQLWSLVTSYPLMTVSCLILQDNTSTQIHCSVTTYTKNSLQPVTRKEILGLNTKAIINRLQIHPEYGGM